MVNPLLTVLFDMFLIGSGVAVLTGMYIEYRASRRGAVGGLAVPFQQRAARRPATISRTRARGASVGRARRRLAA